MASLGWAGLLSSGNCQVPGSAPAQDKPETQPAPTPRGSSFSKSAGISTICSHRTSCCTPKALWYSRKGVFEEVGVLGANPGSVPNQMGDLGTVSLPVLKFRFLIHNKRRLDQSIPSSLTLSWLVHAVTFAWHTLPISSAFLLILQDAAEGTPSSGSFRQPSPCRLNRVALLLPDSTLYSLIAHCYHCFVCPFTPTH